ncbi:GNAT family N-acetyltransferase [Microbacterium xanthum]|uniref:GNAT family N-acetyltransferase n=1 Tax=Microbacterium xanthum TaxID=3079794 RepID=UPI002AD4B6D8|nr:MULTISPECIES: GNAT family N-acetyltransferase [unclassified Microbacterium]MDZ8171933.1 GNAT family N-acetyltransferase [Microbacterium sp. KSW-48]MDZ8199970.1 GNAT family N-acetyltransferase [Microbacterium sp. SSW1-59]
MTPLRIVRDDLTSPATLALLRQHRDAMRAGTPPESCHVLELSSLRDASVIVLSAWSGSRIAGVGAVKLLDGERGEIKSMRVADAVRGTGVGRAILAALVDVARSEGLQTLWLETGSSADFAPAHRLYRRAGFTPCAAFDDYVDDPLSLFLTRPVTLPS